MRLAVGPAVIVESICAGLQIETVVAAQGIYV